MAIGDRFKLTAIGTHLGSPVSFSVNYEQVQADPAGPDSLEAKLTSAFFVPVTAPWAFWRAIVSTGCIFTAAVVKALHRTVTVGLTDVKGNQAATPLSSDTSIMLELLPRYPNKFWRPGRIWIPGITHDASWHGGVRAATEATFLSGSDRLINLRFASDTSPTWRLIPSLHYGLDGDMPISFQFPFVGAIAVDPIMRRLKTRKATSITEGLLAAAGHPGWGQIEVEDPEEPAEGGDEVPELDDEFTLE